MAAIYGQFPANFRFSGALGKTVVKDSIVFFKASLSVVLHLREVYVLVIYICHLVIS